MQMSKRARILIWIGGVALLGLIVLAIFQFSPSRRLSRHLVKARISSNAGQYGIALTEYEKALAIQPDNEQAICELGFVRLALEQADRARDYFEKCVKLHPEYQRAWLGLARVRIALKDLPGAAQAAQKRLELNKDSEGLQIMGEAAAARGAYDEALNWYRQAMTEAPLEYEPVRRTVELLRSLKRDSESMQVLAQYSARNDAKDREKALTTLAEMKLKEDRFNDALNNLERAVELHSTPDLLLRRAEVLLALNEFDRAKADIDEVFKQQPAPPPVANKIRASCLFEKNELDAALRDALVAQRALSQDATVALLLARIYYKAGKPLQAEEQARAALVLSPDFFPAQNFLLSMLVDQKHYDQAIDEGRKLAKRTRRNEVALRLAIRACIACGKPETAKTIFQNQTESRDGSTLNLASMNPDESAEETINRLNKLDEKERETTSTQFLLGQAYLRARKLPDALRALQRATELDPNLFEPQVTLAGVLLALGSTDLAADRLEAALKTHPDSFKLLDWLSKIRLQQKNYKEADELYARIFQLDKKSLAPIMMRIKAKMLMRDVDGLNELAQTLQNEPSPDLKAVSLVLQAVIAHNKNPKAAWDLIDKAVEVAPSFGPALQEKAINSIHEGKLDEALQLFSRVERAEIKPSGYPRLDYGTALLIAGKIEDARNVAAEEHLLLKNPESLMLLVATSLRANEADAAREQIQAMAERNNFDLQALNALTLLPQASAICEKLALADVYSRAGRRSWAAESLEAAVNIAPDNTELLAIRANGLMRQGRIEDGIAQLSKIADQNPKRTDYRMLIAGAEQARGNADAAIQHFHKVLDADPQHPAALSALGTLLLQKEQFESASEYLYKAVKAAPDDIVPLNNYVWVTAVELKTPKKALPFAESLQRQAPNNPHVLDTVGWVYYLSEDVARAIQTLSYAAAIAPGNPDIAYHHAIALKADNKIPQAVAELKRALSMKKDFKNASDAERLLGELEKQKLVDGAKPQ